MCVSPVHLFQICDSIGLAKQIAFHSEMVSPFNLHSVKILVFYCSSFFCVCVCVGSEGRGKEEGAGKSKRETAGRAQQAEADREGDL